MKSTLWKKTQNRLYLPYIFTYFFCNFTLYKDYNLGTSTCNKSFTFKVYSLPVKTKVSYCFLYKRILWQCTCNYSICFTLYIKDYLMRNVESKHDWCITSHLRQQTKCLIKHFMATPLFNVKTVRQIQWMFCMEIDRVV